MTRPDSRLSFRNIPPAIYVALAFSAAGSLTVALATLLASDEGSERFMTMQRLFLVDAGCDAAATILLALGLLELAKRHVGARRVLTQVAAGLGFAGLAWLGVRLLIAFLEPSSEKLLPIYEWLGRGGSVIGLAAAVLLTLGADAWRRAPIAAVGLVVLDVTARGIPIVGEQVMELIGDDRVTQQLYGIGRLALFEVTTLLVIAALAAGGHDPSPDPRAAAAGFRIARGALIFRLVAAAGIAMVMIGGRSPSMGKLVVLGGPMAVIVTMFVFAVALQRVASARLEGMPRLLLSLGAALTLWWGTIQLDQLAGLIEAMRESYRSSRALETAQLFSIMGPIAATLGLALVGSAISSYAARCGDGALRAAATGRTLGFLLATLASIGVQSQLVHAKSIGEALVIVGFGAIAAITGLVVLAGLLARAAESLEAAPGLPPARVV